MEKDSLDRSAAIWQSRVTVMRQLKKFILKKSGRCFNAIHWLLIKISLNHLVAMPVGTKPTVTRYSRFYFFSLKKSTTFCGICMYANLSHNPDEVNLMQKQQRTTIRSLLNWEKRGTSSRHFPLAARLLTSTETFPIRPQASYLSNQPYWEIKL